MSLSPARVPTCMQCGKCTGSCPEAGRTPFNIRMIVRKKQFQRADRRGSALVLHVLRGLHDKVPEGREALGSYHRAEIRAR